MLSFPFPLEEGAWGSLELGGLLWSGCGAQTLETSKLILVGPFEDTGRVFSGQTSAWLGAELLLVSPDGLLTPAPLP